MKKLIIIMILIVVSQLQAFCGNDVSNLKVQVLINPEEGFMANGWGQLKFNFESNNQEPIQVKEITGVWMVNNKTVHNWSQKCQVKVPSSGVNNYNMILWMPNSLEKLSTKQDQPYISGNVILNDNQKIPYKIIVPIAELPSELKSIEKKYVKLTLQENTWTNVKFPNKVVSYLDKCYGLMKQLTGNTPFDGSLMEIKECPRHPYFAYAGNPIVLNTAFVPNSVSDFDNDHVNFGWVHEMGHDFDNGIGQWYNEGTFTEFQANIKLSYVIEKMCTSKSKIKIISWLDKKTPLDGVRFDDEYFLPYGEKYLQSNKPYTDMISDDYHALFLTVIRQKGWGIMKDFYKVYTKLAKSDLPLPPRYEKIPLVFAVLDYVSGTDLAPLYQKWRIPLDRKMLDALIVKYQIR